MPLLEKFRRPMTSSSGEKHSGHGSSTQDGPESTSSSPERTRGRHRPIGSLQKLSLSLPKSDGNAFEALLSPDLEVGESDRGSPSAQLRLPGSPVRQTSPSRDGPSHPVSRPSQSEDRTIPDGSERANPRFSLLKFRHASDPQLSTRYQSIEPRGKEMPLTPTIITTAPTAQALDESSKRKTKNILIRSLSPFRKSQFFPGGVEAPALAAKLQELSPEDTASSTPNLREHKVEFEDHVHKDHVVLDPPAYGDDSTSSLAIPVSRLSESGGSDGSSTSHKLYARTTTTHTITTTTSFFKVGHRKKKKDKGPLFPLPERFPKPSLEVVHTPRTATSVDDRAASPLRQGAQNVHFASQDSNAFSPIPSPTHSMTAITNAPLDSPGPPVLRKESMMSNRSGASTPSISLLPPRLGARGRSSTMGSVGKNSNGGDVTPHLPASGRTSTSTNGRRSFGDILMLSHRLRQTSVPPRSATGHSPGTPGSKSNSMQLCRDEPEFVYPSREPNDTPASYLEKLEAAVPRGSLATILCKNADEFSKTCLRKYMRGFSYFQESIDMSIRKMLMEVELPKETQQIDRLLAGFADRYHECNPGVFTNADEAGIVAFSILLLHSDNHNKNNKRKMTKEDYVKNTQHGQVQVSGDILETFYDNICYTPFIHFEDDVAVHSHRLAIPKSKKALIRSKSSDNLRGQVDPYTLILDNKLDQLRPSLEGVMDTEDTYSSTGTLKNPNSNDHHKSFVNSAILQIVSARSRPDAFMTQATISNPVEAQAGLVSIKIAKVGLLWRKDPKKKKAKRPWQEWGAILTDSKLYFFKDVGWVKKLVSQYEAHVKSGRSQSLIFKPPLTSFEPDALMAMDDAVALMDSSYKKHKHAFTFIKHGGFEEIFLANTEAEMDDWIGKVNYAATFRTAGVRMRGLLGTNYEGRHLLRKGSDISAVSNTEAVAPVDQETPTRKIDPQMAWEIIFYRHQLVKEKISSYEDRLAVARVGLDHLLRNARHLLLLLPIQQKTREALVFAAGRMSAKLKWTRVEMWRIQTHASILKKDLDAEDVSDFPSPEVRSPSLVSPTQQRATHPKPPHSVAQVDADATGLPVTGPVSVSASGRRPSQAILDQIKVTDATPDHIGSRSPNTSPAMPPEQPRQSQEHDRASATPSLRRQASAVSSLQSRHGAEQPVTRKDDDPTEEQVLRQAGLTSVDTDALRDPRRRGSEADKDQVVVSPASVASPASTVVSPTSTDGGGEKHRGSSVRRSLQRTLRDSSHINHTPSHHRKKGKESGSSATHSDELRKSTSVDSEELKRGAGSFILHGKKASVITMSPEWQAMTKDERHNRRSLPARAKQAIGEEEAVEDSTGDGTVSEGSGPGPAVVHAGSELGSPITEDFVSTVSSRGNSISMAPGNPADVLSAGHSLTSIDRL